MTLVHARTLFLCGRPCLKVSNCKREERHKASATSERTKREGVGVGSHVSSPSPPFPTAARASSSPTYISHLFLCFGFQLVIPIEQFQGSHVRFLFKHRSANEGILFIYLFKGLLSIQFSLFCVL